MLTLLSHSTPRPTNLTTTLTTLIRPILQQTKQHNAFRVSSTTPMSDMTSKPPTNPPFPLTSLTSTVPLSPNQTPMPILGYGVYQTPTDICTHVVTHALKTGYRHIDSAQAYRNEAACSTAINSSTSPVPRADIFFTSKISPRNMGYDKTKASITETLKVTGMTYIDLMLIHAPYGGTNARNGTWRALVEAQTDGIIKSIGVSNYGVHHLNELKSYIETSGVGGTISVGQWELHPWLPRDDIVTWARENNVVIQAWSPLVRGERAEEQVLAEIGEKHGKTWAQVLVRWSLQRGFVPLPKSVTEGRIVENTEVFDFELDGEDMRRLEFPGSYAPCSWDPTVAGLDD